MQLFASSLSLSTEKGTSEEELLAATRKDVVGQGGDEVRLVNLAKAIASLGVLSVCEALHFVSVLNQKEQSKLADLFSVSKST